MSLPVTDAGWTRGFRELSIAVTPAPCFTRDFVIVKPRSVLDGVRQCRALIDGDGEEALRRFAVSSRPCPNRGKGREAPSRDPSEPASGIDAKQ